MATSRKCPERFSSRQTPARNPHEMRSSPPSMDTESDQEDLSTTEGQEEMDVPQHDLEQNAPRHAIPISSDMSVDDSLLPALRVNRIQGHDAKRVAAADRLIISCWDAVRGRSVAHVM